LESTATAIARSETGRDPKRFGRLYSSPEKYVLPEISEFSYGFALTNEIVGWEELRAAPVFPSLVEEGRAGGGYDVKLDRPGAPLYLQFKRSEFMVGRSSREYRRVRHLGGSLSLPFYRFPITEAGKSDQHEMLLELDRSPNLVFYVAPRFHRTREINDAWAASEVAGRSIFISPNEVGILDGGRHTVAFDATSRWICSEPREINALTSRQLMEKLKGSLKQDDRPLADRLPEFAQELRDAEIRGRERIRERRYRSSDESSGAYKFEVVQERLFTEASLSEPGRVLQEPEENPPSTRLPKALSPEAAALREAADRAARVFDAQLVIVQPTE
jgi:hypothetical protein